MWGSHLPPPSVSCSGSISGVAVSVEEVPGQRDGISLGFTPNFEFPFPLDVTAGNLIVVAYGRYDPAVVPIEAADCQQSAGTAVLGPLTLDVQHVSNESGVAVWSAIVLSSGSLTVELFANGGVSNAFMTIGVNEYEASVPWGAGRLVGSNSDDAVLSGAINSGLATLAGGAGAFVGVCSINNSGDLDSLTLAAPFSTIYSNFAGSTNFGAVADYIASSGQSQACAWTAVPVVSEWAACVCVYRPGV